MAEPMDDSPAARVVAQLRAARKDQALSGGDIADRIERLTGVRPSDNWVSRRFGAMESENARPRFELLRISEDLLLLCAVLGLDPMDLIENAVRVSVDRMPAFVTEDYA